MLQTLQTCPGGRRISVRHYLLSADFFNFSYLEVLEIRIVDILEEATEDAGNSRDNLMDVVQIICKW